MGRRYTDSEYLPPMSEPTIAEIARVGMAFGLLREDASIVKKREKAVLSNVDSSSDMHRTSVQ